MALLLNSGTGKVPVSESWLNQCRVTTVQSAARSNRIEKFRNDLRVTLMFPVETATVTKNSPLEAGCDQYTPAVRSVADYLSDLAPSKLSFRP
jgi:hypothetical protein